MFKQILILTLFCIGLSRCANSVDLSSMKIRLWQPEGEDYFTDTEKLQLKVTTARGFAFEEQASNLDELTLDLTTLTPSDTPLELELFATQGDRQFKGAVESYELAWPTSDTPAVQNDPLMFVGPSNTSVPLTQGYPPSLRDTMVCQTHEGALVVGTTLSEDSNALLNLYLMDFGERALTSGPNIESRGSSTLCALDAQDVLYLYGGCVDGEPTGGLQSIILQTNGLAENLTNVDSRSHCHTDLVVTSEHLWLIDGEKLELRDKKGEREQALTLPTEIPFQITHGAQLKSDQIWVWSTTSSENESLRLIHQEGNELTVDTIDVDGTILYVGHNRSQETVCLTTTGLYALNQGSPSLLMNASLIFEGNFQPTQLIESQADRWVFMNDAGSLLRLVEGSTNYDLPQEPPRPQSQLFRGPGGAIFIAGGPITGINLLITDTY